MSRRAWTFALPLAALVWLAIFVAVASAHRYGPLYSASSTAYSPCSSGSTMADGTPTYWGAVASNRHPLGTLIRTRRPIHGKRWFRIRDRIGYGSDLDVFMPSCGDAIRYGRRTVRYRVTGR